ncbi:hypothetical protein J3F83DRAFT_339308 [Trichoderma novae-zelandiae]
MAPRAARQNPIFKELAEIQRYTDVCPNPQDSDFSTCRAKRRDGGRCRNPPCTQYERWQIPSLLSEFRDMTECPNTDSFYDKMETFVTYTHCKRWHRPDACQAFREWKRDRIADRSSSRQRPARVARPRPTPSMPPTTTPVIQPLTAAALQMLPSTPTILVPSSASATSDDGSSFDESVAETRSLASNTTFMSSPYSTPLRNGTLAAFGIRDIAEEETVPVVRVVVEDNIDHEAVVVEEAPIVQVVSGERVDFEGTVVQEETAQEDIARENNVERMQDLDLAPGMTDTVSQEDGDTRENTAIKALGITGLHRSGSVRDHSPVFQIINSHPTPEAYDRVVKQMCNFSVLRLGELMREPREKIHEEASTSPNVSTEAISTTLPQISDTPVEMSRQSTNDDPPEIQQVDESFISPSSHSTKSQRELSAGTKLARKVKRLFTAGDSVKRYFLRPRESKTQTKDGSKRAFGSSLVDLKGKAREAGTKARQEAREFRRDFREELRRKSDEQMT